MKNGGWTLVGKISGKVGNIYKTWLVFYHNTAALRMPKITKKRLPALTRAAWQWRKRLWLCCPAVKGWMVWGVNGCC